MNSGRSEETNAMDYRRKRKLTFFTIGLIFLLSGVEYGEVYFWDVVVILA